VYAIAFHELFPMMVTASRIVKIWSFSKSLVFSHVETLPTRYQVSFMSAVFHHTLPILAISSSDGIVELYRLNIDGTNARLLVSIPILHGSIWSLVFHPFLPIIFVSGSRGDVIVLYFTDDFTHLENQSSAPLHFGTINGIAVIQQNGILFLVTASDDFNVFISSFTLDFGVVRKTTLTHYRKVLSVACHQSSFRSLIVTGSDDRTAKIWIIHINENESIVANCIHQLSHPSGVRCVKFDVFGSKLITGCYDGNVRIWNFDSEAKETEYIIRKPWAPSRSILSIGYNPNDPKLVVIGDDGDEFTFCRFQP
jgi:WD40 repeat protein